MTDGLVAALAKVQAQLPHVGKGKTGEVSGTTKDGRPFKYNYQYADLADIAEAIHPLLAANGLAFIAQPRLIDGQYLLIGSLEHVSNDKREGCFPLPLHDRVTPQQIGSAITYGRRYLLCSLTGVVADEDDDGAAASKAPPQPKKTAPKKQQRPVPDIREPLWADIKHAREAKGWSSDDVASDFAMWSKSDDCPEGKRLMDATADELQSYLETLKDTTDGAP